MGPNLREATFFFSSSFLDTDTRRQNENETWSQLTLNLESVNFQQCPFQNKTTQTTTMPYHRAPTA